jgi:NAD(P)-dependent dehydrogenase (short-subunit alcohol dehydrogenase family)
MVWTTDDIPDRAGTVAVVTGANGGLGLETTRELARHGALVVMGVRNEAKADRARDEILSEIPAALLEVRPLDLGSLESVRMFAGAVAADHPRIELLVNNAGVMATPKDATADGFELQFGTNHLGHFALTALLMPVLACGDDARVVTVTSTARHFKAKLDRDDLGLDEHYTPWRAYGRAKKANLDFALELDRRLVASGSSVRSYAAHPGMSNTNLQAESVRSSGGASQRFFESVADRVGMTPLRGAGPQLRAATDPAVHGGGIYTPRWVTAGDAVRRPVTGWANRREDAALLWTLSEAATGVRFDVADFGTGNCE